jgi:xanthine dehydrogenase molybdenum-binding subunit
MGAPQTTPSSDPRKVVGRNQVRPDAEAKVTGAAVYSDDIKFPGMLHARVKRTGVPHAFLRSLDVSKARQLSGVAAVLTAEDIPGENNHGLVVYDWPVLVGVGERVRYVGDAVAIVAAETREIASQALELIEAAYDSQPVISDPVQARQPETAQLHPSGNLLKHIKVRKGDISAGFSKQISC